MTTVIIQSNKIVGMKLKTATGSILWKKPKELFGQLDSEKSYFVLNF